MEINLRRCVAVVLEVGWNVWDKSFEAQSGETSIIEHL